MSIQSDHKNIAYIAIGSNMGSRLDNCRKAIACLSKSEKVIIENQSDFYLTEPMEYKAQSWFVNAVVKIRTDLDSFALLNALKTIEHHLGRVITNLRYGPRILDMDIIFYNDEIRHSAKLIVPHPRMYYREFVLRPLCDLSPDFIHPVLKKSIKQLLDEINPANQRCIKIKTMQEESSQILHIEKVMVQEEESDEVFY